MKLHDVLAEGLSPILYHSTHANNVLKILKSDSFRLHPYVGNDAEMEMGKMGKMWYMSTTRSKTGGFTSTTPFYAVLKLDGRKLGQKYKGSPMEYWGKGMRSVDKTRDSTEMEDRIYSPKPTIPKASKYITEIHMILPEKESDRMKDYKFKTEIRQLLLEAKKRRIPLYMYDDKSSFLVQNKKKAISIDIKSLKDKGREKVADNSRMRGKSMAKRHIGDVLELIKAPADTKKLSDAANKMRHDIVYQEYYHDGIASNIGNTIHNHAQENLPTINKIVTFMQKKRFKKPMELVKWLQKKWTREE
jgi:hypothetical protein